MLEFWKKVRDGSVSTAFVIFNLMLASVPLKYFLTDEVMWAKVDVVGIYVFLPVVSIVTLYIALILSLYIEKQESLKK